MAILALTTAVSQGAIDSKLLYMLSESTIIDALRVITIGIMATLLVSHPPRPVVLRFVLAIIATASVAGGLYAGFTYQIGLFDTMLALLVGVVFMVEAAEVSTESSSVSSRPRLSHQA